MSEKATRAPTECQATVPPQFTPVRRAALRALGGRVGGQQLAKLAPVARPPRCEEGEQRQPGDEEDEGEIGEEGERTVPPANPTLELALEPAQGDAERLPHRG